MRTVLRLFVALHVGLYRATGGRIGGKRGAIPILLLTTIGRKTGKQRTVPLQYLADGETIVVVASNNGRPNHPGWFHNLKAQPSVEVQIGREHSEMHAQQAAAAARERLWPRVLEISADYAAYQSRTTREIPLVTLEDSR